MKTAIGWICSLLGFGVLYVVLLGHAMSSAPQRVTGVEALGLAVLPLIALVASGSSLRRSHTDRASGLRLLLQIVPILISAISFLMLIAALSSL